jgi:hypothetical protein
VTANGGTLALTKGISGGALVISPAATVDLSGAPGPSTVATLTHDGAGLVLGANAITVTADYTNANFGAGNGFNNRANVTGTGQIKASGNVAQALTGNVTTGATAAPTMDFGNLHVGTTTTEAYDRKHRNHRPEPSRRDPDQYQRRQHHVLGALGKRRDSGKLGTGGRRRSCRQ